MIQSEQADRPAREVITFLIERQEFCIDVMSIREIRVWTPTTPLAHAPAFVCGMINLRGAVLPIIDLADRLGYCPTEPASGHAVLVVQIGQQTIGLLVQGVSEILTIDPTMVQPIPETASDETRIFVTGIVVVGERMISLVALDGILPPTYKRNAA